MIFCPNCGYAQLCPCKTPKCVKMRKRGKKKPWVWKIKDNIQCSKCLLIKPAVWWENLSISVEDKDNLYYANVKKKKM